MVKKIIFKSYNALWKIIYSYKNDYGSRLTYLDYLLNLAFIDGDFSRTEEKLQKILLKL